MSENSKRAVTFSTHHRDTAVWMWDIEKGKRRYQHQLRIKLQIATTTCMSNGIQFAGCVLMCNNQ